MNQKYSPLLAALALLSANMAAATTADDVLIAGILPGWEMPNGHHMAALQLDLAPGWKTYWRSPGDAGIPPLFDWSGSTNVKSVRVMWPSPTVFRNNGMQTIGYHGAVTLPIEVTPINPGQPIGLRTQMDLGVCDDICMPVSVRMDAALIAPGQPDGTIRAALRDLPLNGNDAGLRRISCKVEPIDDGLRLTAVMDLPKRGADETVAFETGQGAVWVAEAKTSRVGSTLTSVTDLVASNGAPFALDRSGITVTVLGEGRSVEIAGCPAP
jgi:DsbC/DsbD-like thiol-disulfide interchange protein